jgi:hypothetical protein
MVLSLKRNPERTKTASERVVSGYRPIIFSLIVRDKSGWQAMVLAVRMSLPRTPAASFGHVDGREQVFHGRKCVEVRAYNHGGSQKSALREFFLSQRNKGGSHCVEKQGGISRFQNQLSKGNPR